MISDPSSLKTWPDITGERVFDIGMQNGLTSKTDRPVSCDSLTSIIYQYTGVLREPNCLVKYIPSTMRDQVEFAERFMKTARLRYR